MQLSIGMIYLGTSTDSKLLLSRFRKRQDNKVGLSSSAKKARRKQNLVSMQFNMINWLVETVSLILVTFQVYVFLEHPLPPASPPGQNSVKESHFKSLYSVISRLI